MQYGSVRWSFPFTPTDGKLFSPKKKLCLCYVSSFILSIPIHCQSYNFTKNTKYANEVCYIKKKYAISGFDLKILKIGTPCISKTLQIVSISNLKKKIDTKHFLLKYYRKHILGQGLNLSSSVQIWNKEYCCICECTFR